MTEAKDGLDGTVLEYTYEELGRARATFQGGQVAFEWLEGPLEGERGEGYEYRFQKLGDQQFFVNWHEPEHPGLVTLVYDFGQRTVASSVLAFYGTENEQRLFETATIHTVERL